MWAIPYKYTLSRGAEVCPQKYYVCTLAAMLQTATVVFSMYKMLFIYFFIISCFQENNSWRGIQLNPLSGKACAVLYYFTLSNTRQFYSWGEYRHWMGNYPISLCHGQLICHFGVPLSRVHALRNPILSLHYDFEKLLWKWLFEIHDMQTVKPFNFALINVPYCTSLFYSV